MTDFFGVCETGTWKKKKRVNRNEFKASITGKNCHLLVPTVQAMTMPSYACMRERQRESLPIALTDARFFRSSVDLLGVAEAFTGDILEVLEAIGCLRVAKPFRDSPIDSPANLLFR